MGFNFSSIVLCKLFSFSLFLVTTNGYKHAQVQGMFVFGSSIVDNGNNNYLKNTSARANYPPYGIDFSLGPSGRFSNGRNPVDVLGELIGLPCLIPPFSDPRTKGGRIVRGVNFASGGSGILDQTGSLAGEVTSLNKQISNLEKITLPDLNARLAPKSSQNHLSKYLFIVGTGGNDYLLNYFTSSPTKRTNLLNFTTVLIATLSSQLKKLHDLGARKFVVFSIQAIGCAPAVTARLPLGNGSCSKAMNEAALLFNDHLKALVGNSSSRMPGSEMVFVNSYKIIRDIIEDPARTERMADNPKPIPPATTTPATRTRQTVKFLTAGAAGAVLLVLAGLTLTGTVVSLVVATPVLVMFSPVLIPAGVVLFLGVLGLVLSGGFGVAAVSALAWIYNYVAGKHPRGSKQVDSARRALARKAQQVKEKAKDYRHYIQNKAHEVTSGGRS